MSLAKKAGVRLRAEFLPNGRNRMMYVTYRFGGFQEIEQQEDLVILENDLSRVQDYPEYVRVHIKN
jgi:hypothetical protein